MGAELHQVCGLRADIRRRYHYRRSVEVDLELQVWNCERRAQVARHRTGDVVGAPMDGAGSDIGDHRMHGDRVSRGDVHGKRVDDIEGSVRRGKDRRGKSRADPTADHATAPNTDDPYAVHVFDDLGDAGMGNHLRDDQRGADRGHGKPHVRRVRYWYSGQ